MNPTLLLSLFLLAGGLSFFYQRLFEAVTVYEYEAGFLYRRGLLTTELAPGRYRLRKGISEIRKLDRRQQNLSIPGQEILTQDLIQLKISLVISYLIQDPRKVLQEIENLRNNLYLHLQILLRSVVQAEKLETLLENPSPWITHLQEQARKELAAWGVELCSLSLKDLMLPGDLKRAYAQVFKVQKEAQAQLEKARGEQAALRSLANAARMLEKNPELLNLRLIHTLENSQNSPTLVFQVGSGFLRPYEPPAEKG
ncbi:hypothetical protein COW36_00990 [bacterium (Candidatus Blackallbacteria) CG17_big_fil_post_rev_8_21_14_2_50_48_46]|uniref:Band 7 domain-containing protein n=1 Tax=bacterium (Candidatus Blackallbacteria) CG17_big_fil_post_rev_8_21_14_2_50_48_46 TaxID=2014261 RepID=A0A2M7GBX7_9BACT|nr:MAG: hypothetical protein COW64_10185 [bacterium (Candidatus Blackallbacteria) CG18_big_fil_WC_8_21_14_2_50_49_26]PIW19443.1 MAG: hypothetical protein COW36_00990 [bacterium (Candidatus Blackallbacteria) CG17_big_fil_post_rev_8_21_14_2_50_48_46]PIW48953.1 MAG: hypothetical protein COW20_07465 [bacterium (Candidatus Blackallbacteria) CG13_big_fil_rev_8_21_14_2_50_49_14]